MQPPSTSSTTPPEGPVTGSFIKNKLKFSRKSLFIFAVVFALIGGFLLWRSFAATPEVVRQEAENMALPKSVAKISTNNNTKSGKHVTFNADLNDTTKASSPVMFPNKATSVSVVAYGNEYSGTCSGRPYVGLKIDGKVVIPADKAHQVTGNWASYSADIPTDLKLDPGTTHTVQLLGSNITTTKNKCSRLLAVDTIIFYGANGSTTPVPTVSLGVSPTTITAGSSATLTWSSSNVKSCTASGTPGAWSGSIEPNKNGSRSTGALSAETTYNLSCMGEDGKTINAAPAKVSVTQPQQPPTGGGTAKGWNGFGAGSWPTASWRPYSTASPFNQPINNPVVHPQSSAIVATALANGVGSLSTGTAPTSDYAHPIYYGQTTDPLVTLDVGGYSLTGMKINVPAGAQAAGGGDGHMAIVTPDGWEYDLWQVKSRTADTIKATIGYRQRYDGPGIVTPAMTQADKTIGGTTAPYFGLHAGVIRASELAAGKINHALFIVIQCGSSDTSFGYGVKAPGASGRGGSGSFVYPAFKGDAACSGTRAPMGARFWLDMTPAQIDATGAPAWERTIAKAMNEYGGYMGDTGGPGFGFQFESSTMYTSLGYPNPFEPLATGIGLKKDPTYGYTFRPSGKINWAQNMRVVTPPSQ